MNEKSKWAELFHNTYERLAPSFGYETRVDTKTFDPESKNGKLMIEVCNRVLDQAIKERDEEWVNHIEDYFKGLVVISDPQATKDNLKNSMK